MKSFYQMLRILAESKDLKEWDPIFPTDKDLGAGPSFTKFLGEGEDGPFTVEVDVDEWGDWEVSGSFWANEYAPNGSEPKIGQPFHDPNDKHGYKGTEFKNPGKKLENLPEPLRSNAKKWVEDEVVWAIHHHDPDEGKPEKPDDYEEPYDPSTDRY